jgi:hypothetical protein
MVATEGVTGAHSIPDHYFFEVQKSKFQDSEFQETLQFRAIGQCVDHCCGTDSLASDTVRPPRPEALPQGSSLSDENLPAA